MSYDGWKTNAPDPGSVETDERHDCDENCRSCGQCYLKTGAEICSKVCEHVPCTLCEGDGDGPDGGHCQRCQGGGYEVPALVRK